MTTTTTPWGDATELLTAAGVEEDPNYYHEFDSPDQKAVLTVPQRIQEAWLRNDPDMFAEIFTENGSLLMRDDQLTSREEIRDYMSKGFQGPFKGAHVKGFPMSMRFLDDNVAVAVTGGGIIMAGQTEMAPEAEIRAVWIIVREDDGQLRLLSHQSSPVKG
jgi:uncharacterized protein (TIGR02246 family)